MPREAIRYSGTNLNGEDFDWLARHGIDRLNLDSLDQLRDWTARVPRAGIGLRLLVDDERSANRIGVTVTELPPAVEICRQSGARLTGLHMYAGTNTLRAGRFLQCLDRLLAASSLVPDLEYIDLGGGFGVAYDARRDTLALAELGAAVAARMEQLSRERGRPVALVLEPGRILVAGVTVESWLRAVRATFRA